MLYDGDGERRVHLHHVSGEEETAYHDQHLTLRDGRFVTKHIYAGQTRIANKMDPDWFRDPPTLYYHPDHLGSTSFASNNEQTLTQRDEYFPSGELWIDASDSRYELRRAYVFTGKELDQATGLYYFGARYYDPRSSVWLSPDPVLARYMAGRVNGGVFRPANLGLYAYAWNNPVGMVDPDGRAPGDPWWKRSGLQALGVAYGTLQAITPVGFVADIAGQPSQDPDFLAGKAAGNIVTGAVQMGQGVILGGGGGAAAVGTGGAALLTGVPEAAMVAGGVLIVQGYGTIQAGVASLNAAMSGSGSGSGAPAAAPAPASPAPTGCLRLAVGETMPRSSRRNSRRSSTWPRKIRLLGASHRPIWKHTSS
ncbi:RHS repeat-associated core domain-containing protein [Sorangium sp. So ce302]|uniref:RHS repeat-associated core domain-containing protein n=1 Tax=Sorangium sp. So ce302 TaxID=3133297 RepID=UPI003F6261D1